MKNCLACGKPIPVTGHDAYHEGPTCKCEVPQIPPDEPPAKPDSAE